MCLFGTLLSFLFSCHNLILYVIFMLPFSFAIHFSECLRNIVIWSSSPIESRAPSLLPYKVKRQVLGFKIPWLLCPCFSLSFCSHHCFPTGIWFYTSTSSQSLRTPDPRWGRSQVGLYTSLAHSQLEKQHSHLHVLVGRTFWSWLEGSLGVLSI